MAENENGLPVIPSDWAEYKIPDPTITFADETTMIGSVVRSSGIGGLWVFPEDNLSMTEIMTIFSNPEKTNRIEFTRDGQNYEIYRGYTKICTIRTGSNGLNQVELGRPV